MTAEELIAAVAKFLERQEQVLATLERSGKKQQGLVKEYGSYIKLRFRRLRDDEEAKFFQEQVASARLRELHLAEIFEGIDAVEVPVGAVNPESAHLNQVDMLYVCAIARHRRASRIFEFGTWFGRTTYHLTLASQGAHVTTLNLPPHAGRPGPLLGAYFKGTERERQIRLEYADSREFDPRPYRKQMDFVFVDANHEYDFVKNDTEKAFKMLAPGGVILWHDFAPKSPGVVRYICELSRRVPLFWIRRSSLVMHLDGVDPMKFQPHRLRVSELDLQGQFDFALGAEDRAEREKRV